MTVVGPALFDAGSVFAGVQLASRMNAINANPNRTFMIWNFVLLLFMLISSKMYS